MGRRSLECLILALAVNCGKTPPPVTIAPPPVSIVAPPAAKAAVKTSITIAAAPDVNPDRSREPKPIVVRVYQLKAEAAFTNARYEALDDENEDEKTLGETFVTRDEFTLQPGQRQVIDVVLADATQYIGVVAAFREINEPDTVWRAVSPIPKRSLTIDVSGRRVVTSVDPAR